jgi:hypothetical protein
MITHEIQIRQKNQIQILIHMLEENGTLIHMLE